MDKKTIKDATLKLMLLTRENQSAEERLGHLEEVFHMIDISAEFVISGTDYTIRGSDREKAKNFMVELMDLEIERQRAQRGMKPYLKDAEDLVRKYASAESESG